MRCVRGTHSARHPVVYSHQSVIRIITALVKVHCSAIFTVVIVMSYIVCSLSVSAQQYVFDWFWPVQCALVEWEKRGRGAHWWRGRAIRHEVMYSSCDGMTCCVNCINHFVVLTLQWHQERGV